jgi:hypothetical protein
LAGIPQPSQYFCNKQGNQKAQLILGRLTTYRSSITLLREKSKAKSKIQTLLGIWTLISHKKPETSILA